MGKAVNSGLTDQLTILQAIDSNDEQIQDIVAKQPLYVYKAVITQGGFDAPSSIVLINTFPSGVFSYLDVGSFILDLGIDLGVLSVTTIQQSCYNGTIAFNVVGYYAFETQYAIDTYDSTRAMANELLTDYTLIIEAYPA